MPALVQVVFLSQAWAEAYLPRPDEALVSITDRGAADANLNDGWAAVLRVSFDDVDPVEMPMAPDEGLVEIQPQEAEQIAAFVHGLKPGVCTLVVHCKHGQSRSAGVAKAVAEAYGLHFPASYRYANNFVHERVLQSLRRLGGA